MHDEIAFAHLAQLITRLAEHLCLVEDELISDFARGALDGRDRTDFLERFACTAERKSRVEFARALQGHVEGRAAEASSTGWLRRPFSLPPWAAAAAALVLMVLGGALVQQIGLAPRSSGVVEIALTSGLMRGEGDLARVRIGSDAPLVAFTLDLGSDRHETYRVTLHDVATGEVWSQANVAPPAAASGTVVVRLPADALPRGDYFFLVEGLSPGREPAPLPRYDFRVVRD